MKTVSIKKTEIGLGLPKITVPVCGETQQDMLLAARSALRKADILEIRLDTFAGLRERSALRDLVRTLREYSNIPLLYTLRTAAEGGRRAFAENEYEDILLYLLKECQPDFVDVEIRRVAALRILAEAEHQKIPTIASFHDFQSTPKTQELLYCIRQMEDAGASIAKIAVMPENAEDVERLLSLGLSLRDSLRIPMVLISMGKLGAITRFGAEQLGSAMTFATAGGPGTAPGQMDADALREVIQKRHDGALRKGHIFLTGFMGTGKTTVAKELSSRTGLPLFEMDREIEAKEGRSIPRIFGESGEAYFRSVESELLEELFDEQRQIVSCGGGTVLRASNVVQMRAMGHVVLLTASPETVYKRLRKSAGSRPLLNGRFSVEGVETLMREREKYYTRAAEIVVDTDGRKVRDIAFEISTRVGCTDDKRDRRY
ncbi:MAG: type I 3-dehydroquinate dehydratase [Lachnospiraceae bacterium]